MFSELLGGRVFEVDDLDAATLAVLGDGPLVGPLGVAVDAFGHVLVAETGAHSIALEKDGGWQRLGTRGGGVREFEGPVGVAFLGNTLIVLDAGNHRVASVADIGGAGWVTFGHPGRPTPGDPAPGAFADPRGLTVDSAGRIWVADPGARRLVRVDAIDGSGWVEVGLPPGAEPSRPYGVSAIADGVAVLDVGNRRLVVLDDAAAPIVCPLDGTWVSPAFVGAAADQIVLADVVANELRLLLLDGKGGLDVVASLRGSPPDLTQSRFDSIGGVAA